MTIQTYNFPGNLLKIVQSEWKLVTASLASSSVFNPVARRRGPFAQLHRVSLSFAQMNDEDAGEVEAFIESLLGRYHALRLFDTSRPLPLGAAFQASSTYQWTDGSSDYDWTNGSASYGWGAVSYRATLQSAALRSATSLIVSGLPGSTANAIARGDRFGIGGNLYRALRACETNSSGQTRIDFAPALRMPAAAGSVIDFERPRGRFILASDDGFQSSYDVARVASMGFDLIEVPYIGQEL